MEEWLKPYDEIRTDYLSNMERQVLIKDNQLKRQQQEAMQNYLLQNQANPSTTTQGVNPDYQPAMNALQQNLEKTAPQFVASPEFRQQTQQMMMGQLPPQNIKQTQPAKYPAPNNYGEVVARDVLAAKQQAAFTAQQNIFQDKASKILTSAKGMIGEEGNFNPVYSALAKSARTNYEATGNPLLLEEANTYEQMANTGLKKSPILGKVTQVARYNEKGELEYGHYEGTTFVLEDTGMKPAGSGGIGGASKRSYGAGVGEQGQYVTRLADGSLMQADGKGGLKPYLGTHVYPIKEGAGLSAADKDSFVNSGESQATIIATAGGLRKSIEKQIGNINAMESFVSNMDKQMGRAIEIGNDIASADTRLLNVPIRVFQESIVGNPNRNKFNMYITELESEAARLAAGNPQSIATLPEGLRETWAKIHDKSLSVSDMINLLEETKIAGKLRMDSNKEALKSTKKQLDNLGGGRPEKPPTEEKFMFTIKKSKAGDPTIIRQAIKYYGKEKAEKLLSKAWGAK